MKILVSFAVEWELRPWRRLRDFRPQPGNEGIFHARIEGSEIKAVLTGVGAQRAARALSACIDEPPDLCIVSGLAGGLKHEHRSGDVLAARRVRRHSAPDFLASNERFFRLALERGAKGVEFFVSTAGVARTAKWKSELGALADAVDMESFAVMEAMGRFGIPCVAIRSVADEVERDLVCDFDRTLDASGRVRLAGVLGQVACAPQEWWPLMKFGVVSSRAAGALARYLDAYVSWLAKHQESSGLPVEQVVE